MDIFKFRNPLIDDYTVYINSVVARKLSEGALWPQPLIQLNVVFMSGLSIDELVEQKVLHEVCRPIFRRNKSPADGFGKSMRLHRHQEDAIRTAVG